MKHAYDLTISLRHPDDLSLVLMLNQLQRFIAVLERLSPNLRRWLLGGKTKEEALLYEVFRDGKPSPKALAVLEAKRKRLGDPMITIWNGKEHDAGASLQYLGNAAGEITLIEFVGRPDSFSSDVQAIVEVVKTAVDIWSPDYVALKSNGYWKHRVFKDRPGVGWMLYLPRVLTVQQVPEAAALVPVSGKDEQGSDIQRGTIIVSVTDAPFSDANPEHIKIANAIEIRLVDQDLLPRFGE